MLTLDTRGNDEVRLGLLNLVEDYARKDQVQVMAKS